MQQDREVVIGCFERTPLHLQRLLLRSISFAIANLVLELLLYGTNNGLGLEARILRYLRIHVLSNKISSEVCGVFLPIQLASIGAQPL